MYIYLAMNIRIGIIGPGRQNNGIGEYITKYFHYAGADILAVVASSQDSAIMHASKLKNNYGITCIAYSSAKEMFSSETLDAVAICSPAELHLEHLLLALENSVHVFCEKPLVWEKGGEIEAVGYKLIREFRKARLIMHHNTQWVYTLPYFEFFYGRINKKDPLSVIVELAPSSSHPATIIKEAAPHANSILLALGARGSAFNISFFSDRFNSRTDGGLEVSFNILGKNRNVINARYVFRSVKTQPRPASYSINGRRVHREIDFPNYITYMCAEKRDARVQFDPLYASVSHFLKKIDHLNSKGNISEYLAILENLKLLGQLYREYINWKYAGRSI